MAMVDSRKDKKEQKDKETRRQDKPRQEAKNTEAGKQPKRVEPLLAIFATAV